MLSVIKPNVVMLCVVYLHIRFIVWYWNLME